MRRELLLPLGVYVGVTLVVPAVNGALARPGFAAHAAWTLGLVAAFAAVVGVGQLAWSRMRKVQDSE